MKGTGFIVVCAECPAPAGGAKGYREHESVASALAEAKRLATKEKGKLFVVYEPVLHAIVKDPVEVTDLRQRDPTKFQAAITNEIFGTPRPNPIFDPLFYRMRTLG